ncbi:aspartyl protease family protein [Streptomyces sp. NPDC020983]|uniref:aspartyl protease family protein n=1 Tax=Streptomyces sp. NPDC020983 TaxID=3365106 RepID=UPI0037894436
MTRSTTTEHRSASSPVPDRPVDSVLGAPSRGTGLSRRGLLRRAGLAAGAALPLLGLAATTTPARADVPTPAPAPGPDPDQLFQDGDLTAAEYAYARLLRADPGNAHAAAQLGYLCLLSDRLTPAGRLLREALRLDPGDDDAKRHLSQCYLRQNLPAPAGPLLPPPEAARQAALTGTPYEIRGAQSTRVPFLALDPLPQVSASVNGGASGRFVLDTGAADLTLTTDMAQRLGLKPVAMSQGMIADRTVTTYLGVASSLRLGGIEVRNVPVTWIDGGILAFPDGTVTDGTIGMSVFYRFITTLDYARQALVLRRKNTAQQRALRTEAARAGLHPQPLWLADHLPCTPAVLNGYGPRIATMDTGGAGAGVNTSPDNAARAAMAVDWSHPTPINGGAVTVYPATVDRVALGAAVAHHVPASVGPTPWEGMTRFSTIGNITHEFYKPFAVTFDFATMRLYIG